MNEYQDLIEALNLAIRNVNKSIDIEQRISHDVHKHQGLVQVRDQLEKYREGVVALRKRMEVVGR
jgi:hypothetical protein